MGVLLIARTLRLVGRLVRTPVNYTSLVAVVTLADLQSRFTIAVYSNNLLACLCCHFAFFNFSVGVENFVTGLNHISSFLSGYF